jgi:hypothetical protein
LQVTSLEQRHFRQDNQLDDPFFYAAKMQSAAVSTVVLAIGL